MFHVIIHFIQNKKYKSVYKLISKIIVITISLIFLTNCSVNTRVINNTHNNGDYVVVLHAILTNNWYMQSLSNHLSAQGYEVINVNYPSTKYNLQELKSIIIKDIKNHVKDDKPVHFVGFSMGGLLLRATLNEYRPKQMGRVVHIATPNNGSILADKVKDQELFKLFYGPAGQQLITDQSEFKNIFGEVDYELGVISGSGSYNVFLNGLFDGDHDGRVSVKSTQIKGMKDHIKVKGVHSIMPFLSQVQEQTSNFIKDGRFKA